MQPLADAKNLFERVTAHVKLTEIKSEGSHPTIIGYRTTLTEVLTDSIRTESFGIEAGNVNEMKITGDGGRLSPKYPMTCLFVQSLSMKDDQQSLSSSSPLSIVVAQETYDIIKKAVEGLNKEMKGIEQKGLKVDGKTYKFRFFFCADLKFMWLVTSLLQ